MNKTELLQMTREELKDLLIGSLKEIIDIYENGIIPGNPEKSKALNLIEAYKETVHNQGSSDKSLLKIIKSSGKTTFNERTVLRELSGLNKGIILLIRLYFEKLIPANDQEFSSEYGKKLINGGYVDEVVKEEGGIHYYILSNKGRHVISKNDLLNKMYQNGGDNPFVLPKMLDSDINEWTSLYVERLILLNRYFQNYQDSISHLIFSLGTSKEMIFGCKIDGSTETRYYFAGIFNDNKNDDISNLKEILSSGNIDRMIVIVDTETKKKELVASGLDPVVFPQISYEIVKEDHDGK